MSYINKNLNVNSVNLAEYPYKSELFMEAFLIENEDLLKLEGISDEIEIIDYEVPIKGCPRGKTDNGRADILALYPTKDKTIAAIIELKKGKINQTDISNQLKIYLNHKNNVQIKDDNFRDKWKNASDCIGIMVGQDIDLKLAYDIVNADKSSDYYNIGAITLKRFKGDDGNAYIITDTYFPDRIKPYSKLRVTYTNGQEDYGVPTDVYVNAILKIGIDRIYDLQESTTKNPLIFDGAKHKLISDHKYDDTTGHRPVEDGKWWIYTHFSTNDKIKKLEYLKEKLGYIKEITKE